MKTSLLILSALIFASCSNTKTAPVQEKAAEVVVHETPKSLDEAVKNNPFRTESFKARDQYRHPAETLKFFGLKSDMTVIEIIPGSGWYLEILAPFLSEKGRYIMASRTPGPNEVQNSGVTEWSKKFPYIAEKMVYTDFDLTKPDFSLGNDNSADMVLTFRNVHNWMSKGNQDVAFKAFFKVLKKGGTLGVVEHRAPENRTDPLAPSGYVRQSDVIKMAKRAGFRLVARSEINANKKDTKNHPKGVWTLPPTLALKEVDRDKYMAIGESDRMTLRFVKP